MKRRLAAAAFYSAIVTMLLSGVLLAYAWFSPVWVHRTGLVVGATDGRIEIARSDAKLTRQQIAWGLETPNGFASILVGPTSAWRPTISTAGVAMSSTPGPGSMFTLTVLYIPLWPIVVLSAGASGLLWYFRPRCVRPGHCACGYDVRGLHARKCPECGAAIGSLIQRLAATLGVRWRGSVQPRGTRLA